MARLLKQYDKAGLLLTTTPIGAAESPVAEGDGDAGGARDALYDDAVRIVTETGQASISMIQRRLRIGYNRAARMVEEMERDGLVLPADGARPRELRIRAS